MRILLISFGLWCGLAVGQENGQLILRPDDLGITMDEGAILGLLQAHQDIFLRRAAFDFGQTFFKVRGLDSRYNDIFLNGIPMNSLFDGRPDWNQWGGLNDITRSQSVTLGLGQVTYGFGGLQGSRQISLWPSELRKGLRITNSYSNRSYSHRVMATYAGLLGKNLHFALSGSRRWAKEGWLAGAPYNSYSFNAGLEWILDPKNKVLISGIWVDHKRGRSTAVTEEVFLLKGSTYNPGWGFWGDSKRAANTKNLKAPMLHISYQLNGENSELNLSGMLGRSHQTRGRLGYFNAPNPDPVYYRYLPSYYLNSPLGADYQGAALAREGFLSGGQLDWDFLVASNQNPRLAGRASYILQSDQHQNDRLAGRVRFNTNIGDHLTLDTGVTFINEDMLFYAHLDDMVGADYHEDIDPFTETRNNSLGSTEKRVGDIINYHYGIQSQKWHGFLKLGYESQLADGFISASIGKQNASRQGFFQNERFPEESSGEGIELEYQPKAVKVGISVDLSGRHRLGAIALLSNAAPPLRNVFINPREHHRIVPGDHMERIYGGEANYHFRMPKIKGRLSGYYNLIQNTTDIKSYYVDAGFGSDFVQEVSTGMAQEFKGLELGMEIYPSSAVTLSLVASLGSFRYKNNPTLQINFDPAELPEGSGVLSTELNLGKAGISDLHIGSGPEVALSAGVSYSDPKYWWMGMTANFIDGRYVRPAFITRTESFLLDPETGTQFPEASPENVGALLKQKAMAPVYLLNLIGGKSWKWKDTYISTFFSFSNLFNAQFQSGGYEQGRNGNYGQLYQDQLSTNPVFGPKYWYGQGRSFFLNLVVSL
ncbi:MAG: Plug domain-containing protein [Bacteroidia bacterium]|nr:Plug domain-containing protein [Bacteroidia bacterium]